MWSNFDGDCAFKESSISEIALVKEGLIIVLLNKTTFFADFIAEDIAESTEDQLLATPSIVGSASLSLS